MTRVTCSQCVYWEPPPDDDGGLGRAATRIRYGECRHSPLTRDGWPEVSADGWCGQARALELEPEAQSVVEAARRVVAEWADMEPPLPVMLAGAILDLREELERVEP